MHIFHIVAKLFTVNKLHLLLLKHQNSRKTLVASQKGKFSFVLTSPLLTSLAKMKFTGSHVITV